MRRSVELIGLAVVAQAAAVWSNAQFQTVSTLTDPAEPVGQAFAMLAVAGLAGLLAWRVFRPSPAAPGIGFVLLALGAVMTFAWPIAFAAAAPWVDLVAPWGSGPALPQWEGAMTAAIGASLLTRLLLSPRIPRDIQ